MKTLIRHHKNIRALTFALSSALALVTLLLTPATVSAQTTQEWHIFGSGDWTEDRNWEGVAIPNNYSIVIIEKGTAYLHTGESGTAASVIINSHSDSGSIGAVHLEGDSTLHVLGNLTVGSSGTGILNISDNATVSAPHILIGNDSTTARGTINLHGGVLETTGITKGSGSADILLNGGTLRATSDNTFSKAWPMPTSPSAPAA